MKLLGYVRVSTAGQSDNFSIEDQKNKIKSFCQTYDHDLIDIYEDTKSGSSLDRKELTNLLSNLSNYDGLIIYKLDRLSRSAKDTLEIVELLQKSNKTIVSVSENIDINTAQGKLFLTMIAGFSEYERELIKERVTNGRKAKKEKGGYSGGQPKLGYSVKHETISLNGKLVTNKTLVVNEKEQEIIKLVKNHKRAGKSLYAICKFLNDNGYQTKQGKQFNIVQIKRILENESTKKS